MQGLQGLKKRWLMNGLSSQLLPARTFVVPPADSHVQCDIRQVTLNFLCLDFYICKLRITMPFLCRATGELTINNPYECVPSRACGHCQVQEIAQLMVAVSQRPEAECDL